MEADERAVGQSAELSPCITFPRKIGVGALELADIVVEKLNCAVADREFVRQIAGQAGMSEASITYFDEQFPGYINRTMKYLFGEKSFIDSDYTRHMFSAIFAIKKTHKSLLNGRSR